MHPRTHADPAPDRAPELYTIDGEVPPDVLQARVEWLRRNPSHTGLSVGDILERKSLGVAEAAALLGVERADLAAVIRGRAPVTIDLALRLEAAGWDTAERWLRWQVDYDVACERRRRAELDAGGPPIPPPTSSTVMAETGSPCRFVQADSSAETLAEHRASEASPQTSDLGRARSECPFGSILPLQRCARPHRGGPRAPMHSGGRTVGVQT